MDPNDTFSLPEYGGPPVHQPADDPYSILSRLLSVARSDGVYRDLEELLMIPGSAAGLEAIQDLWQTIHSIGRYTLRTRTEEYLRLALDKGHINRDAFEHLILTLDQPERWKGYYTAVRAIEALNPHFQNLRYRVWREVYRPSDGRRPLESFPPDLMQAVTRQMQALLERSLNLQQERTALAESFFQEAGIADFDINQFYEYAQAMQVLESLAGLKGKGRMDIARITPFDIYAESAVMRDQHPLAGGALGAFGGFLSKNWRLNDFCEGIIASPALTPQPFGGIMKKHAIRFVQARLNTRGLNAGPEDGILGPRTDYAFEELLRMLVEHYGIQEIQRLRLDLLGGCLNVRTMRGGRRYSLHSWGIAVDYDPERNRLKWGRDRASFAQPEYDPWWKLWEEEGWVSLGRHRNFDWMHIQAARL